jgi:hypothetical protein
MRRGAELRECGKLTTGREWLLTCSWEAIRSRATSPEVLSASSLLVSWVDRNKAVVHQAVVVWSDNLPLVFLAVVAAAANPLVDTAQIPTVVAVLEVMETALEVFSEA